MDINKTIEDLEQAISKAEEEMHTTKKASLSSGFDFKANLLYIIGAAIPVVLVLAFYFIKPKFILDKKERIDYFSLFKWVGLITIVSWLVLYGLHYYKYL